MMTILDCLGRSRTADVAQATSTVNT